MLGLMLGLLGLLFVDAWFILQVSVVNLLQKCCKFEFFINFASTNQILTKYGKNYST